MQTSAALRVDYISLADVSRQPPSWWDSALGVVQFGAAQAPAPSGVPCAHGATALFEPEADICEVWRASGEGRTLAHGAVRYRHDERVLFGCITLAEKARSLYDTATDAYAQVFAAIDAAGFPHLVRIWNFLEQINVESGGEERYCQFNSARQAAFTTAGRATTGEVPAASALGSMRGSPLTIYFIAARAAPVAIENPRQVSAYHYPPQYGAQSPTFSRACVLQNPGTSLFISGTASIVGHQTTHTGDALQQTRETFANIQSLLTEANRRTTPPQPYSLQGLKCKIYVRNAADLPAIRAQVGLMRPAAAIYLHADICRRDLLVEIEATQ
jgi:chorismate lyase / 3-hydroxybenzoate synthase